MERRTALRRRLRSFPLLAWPIAFAFALLLWGPTASADYALSAQPIRAASHKHDVGAYWISKADCQSKDDTISFTFNATPSGPLFQIWVSESTTCAAYTERSGMAPVCTQIKKDPTSITSTPFTVKLKTSEIARALKNVDADCNDTSGVTGGRVVKVNFLFMTNGEDSAPIVVTNGLPNYTVDIQVDLVGPPAPGDLDVTSSEGALAVKLVDPPQATTGVAGYHLYCDPPPDSQAGSGSGCACANIGATSDAGAGASAGSGGSASKVLPPIGGSAGAGGNPSPPPPGAGCGGTGGNGAGGAGGCGGATGTGATGTGATGTGATGTGASGGTAGAGGSTCVDGEITEKSCHSCVLEDATKEGAALPGTTYLCGTIPSNGTEGKASVLSNELTYAVAVAAFDKLGNEGPLSTARCATPKAVSDFFEDYRAAGGKGGGGCSVRPWMRTESAIAPLAAALASLALVLRRRRRARAARRGESS